MVTSIARQSIVIKCNMQKSILLGNYEFYYAAGLISKLFGVEISDEIQPVELFDLLLEKIPSLSPKDEKEKYLLEIIKDFRPDEEYDEQMKELLLWGKTEEYLWQVNPPVTH